MSEGTSADDDVLETFAAHLAEHQLRLTRSRAAVVTACMEIDGHFSIEELHRRLKRQDDVERISMATLYRTVGLMLDAGLVRRNEVGDGGDQYEVIHGRPHHDHLECSRCGKLVEFFSPELEERQEVVAKLHGFKLTGHALLMNGLCTKCQLVETNRPPHGQH
ncbi:MAG: Fur family transcriptional regulator [Myxococcota bacterium]